MRFGTSRRISRTLLALVDSLLIGLTIVLGILARGALPFLGRANDIGQIAATAAPALLLGWACVIWLRGGYPRRNDATDTSDYTRVVLASLTFAAIVGIGCYVLQFPLSRAFYVILFGVGTPLLVLGRVLLNRVVHLARKRGVMRERVLIAGTPIKVDDIAAVLERESWLGYEVAGALVPTRFDGGTGTGRTAGGIEVLGTPDAVPDLVARGDIGAVIFAEGSFPSATAFRRMAWAMEPHDVEMIVVPALTDVSSERLAIRPVAGLPLVHVEPPQSARARRMVKRVFDVAGASALIVLLSPVLLAAALAVRLHDLGPALFRQQRVGLDGRTFRCLKFRSMVVDADRALEELREQNETDGVLFKMAHDPRVTRPGRFLRRYSLDELPQLFNVVRGEMSLVGPRPPLPSEVEEYGADVRRRLRVRPGMTGLWQVSGRSDLSWEDTVRLDLYYVDNWSMLQDLSILARTFNAVVGGRGAY